MELYNTVKRDLNVRKNGEKNKIKPESVINDE